MALPELYDSYPGVFDNWVLNNVANVEPTNEIEELIQEPAGSLDPLFIGTAESKPQVKFDSMDVQTILGQVSLMNGLAVTQHGKLQYIRRVDGGGFQSGNSHVVLSTTKGFLYVEEISVDQSSKDGAKASLMYQVLYDGTNAPVNVLTGQALTGSPAVNAVHHLGPISFEGAHLPGVTKMSFKTGLEYERAPCDGVVVAQVGTIKKRAPELTLTSIHLPQAAHNRLRFDQTMPLVDPLLVYLVKRLPGGAIVPYNQNVHILLTITAGTYRISRVGGSARERATVEISVKPLNNGLSISTTSQVS